MNPVQVADLIAEIIEDDDVATDDNFFDIGGNSILALTLIASIRERSGVALRLIDVVKQPTPAGLARILASRGAVPGAATEARQEWLPDEPAAPR